MLWITSWFGKLLVRAFRICWGPTNTAGDKLGQASSSMRKPSTCWKKDSPTDANTLMIAVINGGMMMVLLVEKIVVRKLEKNNVMLLLRQLVWMVGMTDSKLHRTPSVHRTVGSTVMVMKGVPSPLGSEPLAEFSMADSGVLGGVRTCRCRPHIFGATKRQFWVWGERKAVTRAQSASFEQGLHHQTLMMLPKPWPPERTAPLPM